MTYCQNCGASMQDGVRFCPNCGAPANAQHTTPNYADVTQTPDMDIANNRAVSYLSYLGFLFLIPLVTAGNSPFARFHANQGLVLFLFEIALGVLVSILSPILLMAFWVVGAFLVVILQVVWLLPLIFAIVGMLNVSRGYMIKLPIIGNITLIR